MFQEIVAVKLRTDHNLVNFLARDNDMLVNIVHDFTSQIQDRRYLQPQLFCFYETKSTMFGNVLGIETDRVRQMDTVIGLDYVILIGAFS